MKVSTAVFFASLSFLLSTAYCSGNHQRDFKWESIVSQFEAFWKNETEATPLKTELTTEKLFSFKDDYRRIRTSEIVQTESTTEDTSTPYLLQSGDIYEKTKQGLQLSLGVIISIPIIGILVLVCCCYCICRCCCGACQKDEKIIVMQNNMPTQLEERPIQQVPTQIIVHQPIYQQTPQQLPPPYEMQQQHHQQQFSHQQFQQFQQQSTAVPPQYYAQGGICNPNFNPPTAPGYVNEKY